MQSFEWPNTSRIKSIYNESFWNSDTLAKLKFVLLHCFTDSVCYFFYYIFFSLGRGDVRLLTGGYFRCIILLYHNTQYKLFVKNIEMPVNQIVQISEILMEVFKYVLFLFYFQCPDTLPWGPLVSQCCWSSCCCVWCCCWWKQRRGGSR